MAKDPAFLFYPGDYISGTMHLDFECKGAYIDLLMLQFQKDRMTIHMIKHVLGHKYDHIWSHLVDKFSEKDGFFWNERLKLEKELRIKFCKSRKENKLGGSHVTDHVTQHMEDINEDININNKINVRFEDFWNHYDKKIERDKCERKWNKLTDVERTKAMFHVEQYKKSQPDKQYRKNPDTYLNNKSWNDEIIKTSQNGRNEPKKDVGGNPIAKIVSDRGFRDL